MRKVFVAIVSLILFISLLPNAYADQQSIGLSYIQVTKYLSNSITLHKSSSVRGQTRYLGTTNDKLAILEVIGQKKNISQATLVIGLPKDSQPILMRNGAMLLRFMTNIAPDWSDSTRWATNALGQVTSSSNNSTYTIRGNKRIEMTFQRQLAMVLLTVKHK